MKDPGKAAVLRILNVAIEKRTNVVVTMEAQPYGEINHWDSQALASMKSALRDLTNARTAIR